MFHFYLRETSGQSACYGAGRARCGVLEQKIKENIYDSIAPRYFMGSNLSCRDHRKEDDWSLGCSCRLHRYIKCDMMSDLCFHSRLSVTSDV